MQRWTALDALVLELGGARVDAEAAEADAAGATPQDVAFAREAVDQARTAVRAVLRAPDPELEAAIAIAREQVHQAGVIAAAARSVAARARAQREMVQAIRDRSRRKRIRSESSKP